MKNQKTIIKTVKLNGIGLHTGKKVNITLYPASINSGINFRRIDLPDKPVVNAHVSNLIETSKSLRRTSIGLKNAEIHTIEHLMAALCGLGIDNLLIEIDSAEVPGLDGSALKFIKIIKEAGIEEQTEKKRIYTVKEPLFVQDRDTSIIILPANEFKISYTLSYEHTWLGVQYCSFNIDADTFEEDIAPSRTFCLDKEADALKGQGLGKGADYTNTLVVGENGVLDNKLRFDNEFARHKILDLIGDLYLMGCAIKGHVIAVKSGHLLNLNLVQKINRQKHKTEEAALKLQKSFPTSTVFGIEEIQNILPHRQPFLLVDRIIELIEDKKAVGIKNVTMNEDFFRGHFPGKPIMPGVLIIEALAQVAGIIILSKAENMGKLAFFMGVNNAKFRKPVVPGDQLRLEIDVIKLKSKTGLAHAQAFVGDDLAAEADLSFFLADR